MTASDGSLAISSNKFTVAGDTGNTVVAGCGRDAERDGTGRWRTSSRWLATRDGGVEQARGWEVCGRRRVAAISSNKFTVAGDTGNKLAGTLNATGAATLSSTLDVAGGVDVNSGKFAVTASDKSLAISSNKFTVAGDTGNTVVSGHLAVGGPTGDSAKEVYVTGDIEATGTLAIGGDATFAGAVTVTGLFTALGDYRIGDSAPSDSLTVNAASNYTGTTTMSNTLDVIGAATLESTLSVGGATTLSSTLGVVSDVRIGAVGARKLVVSGSDGSLAIQTNKFTVAGNTGNTVVAGTLDAGGLR